MHQLQHEHKFCKHTFLLFLTHSAQNFFKICVEQMSSLIIFDEGDDLWQLFQVWLLFWLMLLVMALFSLLLVKIDCFLKEQWHHFRLKIILARRFPLNIIIYCCHFLVIFLLLRHSWFWSLFCFWCRINSNLPWICCCLINLSSPLWIKADLLLYT